MAGLSERVCALMREDLCDLVPYDPAFTPSEVNLSANENTWPVSDERLAAYAEALERVALNRYPDPLASELRHALARRHGLGDAQVLVSNGADEGLFNLLLAFAGPGRRVLIAPPTFEEYRIFAKLLGSDVAAVWRDAESFALDGDALVEASRDAQVTILCSPNNPTGDLAAADLVRRVHGATKGLVLVDEAYVEFSPEGSSLVPLLGELDRLLVARTFSKAFSLAGARCGYLLAAPDVIQALASVRQIYSVNAVTQAIALVALEATDEVAGLVAAIVEERGRLEARLAELARELPIEVFPSEANFLLLRMPHAAAVRARLRDEDSVLVRDFSATPGLAGCLRVAVGTPEEDDRFLAGLARILADECADNAPTRSA